jgi:hypothetical protein
MRILSAAMTTALRLTVMASVVGPTTRAANVDRIYYDTLYQFCDTLLSTQITTTESPDRGALVCPSVNPQPHPLHSRAGEAVYPLAIAFRETGTAKYRDAAIILGDWMIAKQQAGGAWGEEWPKYDGWAGTTSDQLISLAGAYEILRDAMTTGERATWQQSMRKAADYIARTFPAGNINYQPTGAVALVYASRVVADPPEGWRKKADSLIALTLAGVNADGFITGEGNGVDLGYNLAQTIGYLALYGHLTSDVALRRRTADLLRVHSYFVYPNGTVDNSWGTRSFKWTYESGTKTAPGVYFTFALLQDEDATFAPAGRLCLDYLIHHDLSHGFVTYGSDAPSHASTEPPCLYGTFARAQSLALAIAYAPPAATNSGATTLPAQRTNWFKFFPTTKVTLVRTPSMMATISAYGEAKRYGRGQVPRGGSITNLWIDGFGPLGMAQAASVTLYKREEPAHMPVESALLPLTPRIETTINGVYYANLFETDAQMTAEQKDGFVEVKTTGELRSADGRSSGVAFELTHQFYPRSIKKIFKLQSAKSIDVRVVEPFVKHAGMHVVAAGDRAVAIMSGQEGGWRLAVGPTSTPVELRLGADAEKYWCPFPSVECIPVVASFSAGSEPTIVILELSRRD